MEAIDERTNNLKDSWGRNVPWSSAGDLNAVQMVNTVPTPCQYRSDGSGVPTGSLVSKRVIPFLIVAIVRNFARSNTLFFFKNIETDIFEISRMF